MIELEPLLFSPGKLSTIETGNNLEVTGIRVNKYPIDYPNDGSGNVNNDYVYYRIIRCNAHESRSFA